MTSYLFFQRSAPQHVILSAAGAKDVLVRTGNTRGSPLVAQYATKELHIYRIAYRLLQGRAHSV